MLVSRWQGAKGESREWTGKRMRMEVDIFFVNLCDHKSPHDNSLPIHNLSCVCVKVGADKARDIAVIKISAPSDLLTPLPLAPSPVRLRVGQQVLAIGNPYGKWNKN